MSDKQCDSLKIDESSSSLHSPKKKSKEIDPKTKSSHSQRKPSTISNKTVKGQQTINAAIEAMKRKLSPEKEADTSRDNNENGTNNCIYICNMYMFFLITYFMLYNNILLNSVLLTLYGTHVVVKAQVKKHFCSSEIIIYIYLYISDVPLWCGVRMHLMHKLEYFYKFPIESRVACFVHGLSNCMNRLSCVVLMVICFCMGVVGIVFVWSCLRSVDRILCLFLATLFLVCGVVFTCISPC